MSLSDKAGLSDKKRVACRCYRAKEGRRIRVDDEKET